MDFTNFVNEARNVCWLSGYAYCVRDGRFLLRQTSDELKAIAIRVPPTFRAPPENSAIEVKVHVFASGGELELHLVRMKRASINAMPKRATWLNPLRKQGKGFNPFATNEEIRKEIRENLRISDEMVTQIINQATARSNGKDGFTNKVLINGFIGVKAFVPPQSEKERGYYKVMLHQHASAERAVPVRIYDVDQRFGAELKAPFPLNVVAQIRIETDESDRPHFYLATEKNNVGQATMQDFERRKFPEWWLEMVSAHTDRIMKAKQEKQKENGEKGSKATPAKQPVSQPELATEAAATNRPTVASNLAFDE